MITSRSIRSTVAGSLMVAACAMAGQPETRPTSIQLRITGVVHDPYPSSSPGQNQVIQGNPLTLVLSIVGSRPVDEAGALRRLRDEAIVLVLPEGTHDGGVRPSAETTIESRVSAWRAVAVAAIAPGTGVIADGDVSLVLPDTAVIPPGEWQAVVIVSAEACGLEDASGRFRAGLVSSVPFRIVSIDDPDRAAYVLHDRAMRASERGDVAGALEALSALEKACPGSALVARYRAYVLETGNRAWRLGQTTPLPWLAWTRVEVRVTASSFGASTRRRPSRSGGAGLESRRDSRPQRHRLRHRRLRAPEHLSSWSSAGPVTTVAEARSDRAAQ
jgi:hypothetical protein